MKSKDSVLHTQLADFTQKFRRSTGADTVVVYISGIEADMKDDDGDLIFSTLTTFDTSPESTQGKNKRDTAAQVITSLVRTTMQGLNGILEKAGSLRVVLMDKNSGKIIRTPDDPAPLSATERESDIAYVDLDTGQTGYIVDGEEVPNDD